STAPARPKSPNSALPQGRAVAGAPRGARRPPRADTKGLMRQTALRPPRFIRRGLEEHPAGAGKRQQEIPIRANSSRGNEGAWLDGGNEFRGGKREQGCTAQFPSLRLRGEGGERSEPGEGHASPLIRFARESSLSTFSPQAGRRKRRPLCSRRKSPCATSVNAIPCTRRESAWRPPRTPCFSRIWKNAARPPSCSRATETGASARRSSAAAASRWKPHGERGRRAVSSRN